METKYKVDGTVQTHIKSYNCVNAKSHTTKLRNWIIIFERNWTHESETIPWDVNEMPIYASKEVSDKALTKFNLISQMSRHWPDSTTEFFARKNCKIELSTQISNPSGSTFAMSPNS